MSLQYRLSTRRDLSVFRDGRQIGPIKYYPGYPFTLVSRMGELVWLHDPAYPDYQIQVKSDELDRDFTRD